MTEVDLRVLISESQSAWSESTASWLSASIQHFIQEQGRCTICFSGGKTPAAVYEKLAAPPHLDAIQWQHLYGFWGDERAVLPDREDSNFNMVKKALLDHVPIPPENILRIQGELPPQTAAQVYERTLRDFFQDNIPVLDIIMLGIGNDGHTASLFPESDVLNEENRWVAATYVKRLNSWRITMTPLILNQAHHIAFLATGKRKAEVLDLIWQNRPDQIQLPAMQIKPVHGDVTWHVDQEAASIYQKRNISAS